jgi:hypothetical protein
MKKIFSSFAYRFLFTLVSGFMTLVMAAQDSTGTVKTTTTKTSTSTTTTNDWYMQPWVWVVAGAVFLIILIALLRGNSSNTKEVSRSTTVVKDRDTTY